MTKVAIVGSREFLDLDLVRGYVLNEMLKGDLLVSGGARGVDQEAERTHMGRGGTVQSLRPDWWRYGKAAGPIRNADIVDAAEKVVAFWDGVSRGTKSTIDLALTRRKHLEVLFGNMSKGRD